MHSDISWRICLVKLFFSLRNQRQLHLSEKEWSETIKLEVVLLDLTCGQLILFIIISLES